MTTLTPRASQVLNLAAKAATDRGDPYTRTDHILLAIIREGESIAARVLHDLGITEQKVAGVLRSLVPEES
jgi:ATP-dependent Clp protease ATP-binding subunit ClpC